MSLSDRVARLKNAEFLRFMDEGALNLIAFNCSERRVGDGSYLFREGEAAHGAILITKGEVALSQSRQDRNSETSQAKEGDLLDPHAMITRMERSMNAKAIDDVEYLTIDRLTFRRVLEEFPENAERLQDFLAKNFQATVADLNRVARRLDLLK